MILSRECDTLATGAGGSPLFICPANEAIYGWIGTPDNSAYEQNYVYNHNASEERLSEAKGALAEKVLAADGWVLQEPWGFAIQQPGRDISPGVTTPIGTRSTPDKRFAC